MGTQVRSLAAFAAFVRSNRMRASMTQEELAQAVGKSRRWVHDLETGKVNPALGAAIDVAAALGASVVLDHSERSEILDEVFENL